MNEEILKILEQPELAMPLRIADVIGNPQETATVLADEELKDMDFAADLKEKARPTLEVIAVESFTNYTEYKGENENSYLTFYINQKRKEAKRQGGEESFDESKAKKDWEDLAPESRMHTVRNWAVEGASQAGIDHASELVNTLMSESRDAQKMLSEVTLDDLVGEVKKNLPATTDVGDLDIDEIKNLVNSYGPNNWLSDTEIAAVSHILDNTNDSDAEAHQKDVNALMIAATGVHVSWAAIQGPRSTTEQTDLYQEMTKDKDGGISGEELVKEHGSLRIFKDANRTFPEMQKAKFKDGLREGGTNTAMAMAIFEVMKDLVKIGLPEKTISKPESEE